jgi:hypothetical protein
MVRADLAENLDDVEEPLPVVNRWLWEPAGMPSALRLG